MDFQPTEEQQAIIDDFRTGEDLVIEAGAGTGKTSTLRLLGAEQPSRDGIYVAYNRAIADDARASFPNNVHCATAHSLAFRAIGRKFAHRLNGPRLPARIVAQKLGIIDGLKLGDGKELSPVQLARLAIETVGHFCHSAEADIRPYHVPAINGLDGDAVYELKKTVLHYASLAWTDLIKTDGDLKFDHDHYLKIWGLSKPKLLCDYVLLDEAQDANPVIAAIIEGQKHAQRILVGDASQAIYGWRGAKDAMATFNGTRRQLSQSFRFGQPVADEANKWLAFLGATLRLRGFEQIDSRLEILETPAAVLCRTNAGAVAEVMQAKLRGRKPALVGGGDAIRRLALAARTLQVGQKTDHPELFMFDSWQEVQEYVREDSGGSDLKVFVKLIDDFGTQTIISAVDGLYSEDYADLVISTAHKAKGREWDTVRIATDFKPPKDDATTVSNEEAMLAYVAVTRAKLVLDRSGLSWVDSLKPKSSIEHAAPLLEGAEEC